MRFPACIAATARLSAASLLLGGTLGLPAAAVDLAVEDIVVAEPTLTRLTRVDPLTGATATVSSGGELESPLDVAFEEAGTVVVADPDAAAILRVTPATGAQTIVASDGELEQPNRIAVAGDGSLYVVDGEAEGGSVIRVDPTSGAQTLVSSVLGGELDAPEDVAVERNGQLLVVESDPPQVVRVDPTTGAATLLATGFPYLSTPLDVARIALEADGGVLVAATFGSPSSTAVVFRVDPVTGSQTITPVGSGSAFTGLAVEASGDVLVTVPLSGVIRIDASSGSQSSLASLLSAQGIAVRNPACSDGFDNDADGLVDDDDPQCSAADDDDEGISCGLGPELAFLLVLLPRLGLRARGSRHGAA